DGDAALALAGRVQPGERRPLRPRLRRLRAFHVSHPPLPRPPRPSRDQGGARRQSLPGGRPREDRRALLGDRAPRGRCDARRRGVAQELLHAGPRRRGVRRHRERRDRLRALRHARRPPRRRPGAHLRPGTGLLPVRPAEAHAARRAQRRALPARRPRAREGGARGHRAGEDRLHAGNERHCREGGNPRVDCRTPRGSLGGRRPASDEETPQVKNLTGFHAVTSRLRQRPQTIREIYVDAERKDARAKELRELAQRLDVRVIAVDAKRLDGMAGGVRHQGVVAQAEPLDMPKFIEDVLEGLEEPPLLLVLDGVQDPHNLGAYLRVADGAGAHAVIAPKDRSCGLTTAAIKVASGAAESVPYIVVTNLARTMRELKERGIWLAGADDSAPQSIYESRLDGALGLVLGAEGEGLRRLTRESCDLLVSIRMLGAVASLNVSVASGICLY